MLNILDIELIRSTIVYFILGAATIIIAIAWNNAFTNMINQYFPNKNTNVFVQFLYAFLLTFSIVLLLTLLIGKDSLKKRFNY